MTGPDFFYRIYIDIPFRTEKSKMQIIRISPKSFKIILTKDDLALSGNDNTYEQDGFSKDFFTKIIDEANRQYGADFGSGVIDARFFEDKCGGGELFLCEVTSKSCVEAYAVFAESSDDIICLCKRINSIFKSYSSLYFDGKYYILLLNLHNDDQIAISILHEYGFCKKISAVYAWSLEEHSKKILSDNAVSILAST